MNDFVNYSDIDLTIDIAFYAKQNGLPSAKDQCEELWSFAKSLQRAGLELDQWYVSGDRNAPAFSASGPTDVAIQFASDRDAKSAYQTVNIWNGREGALAAGFASRYTLKGFSNFQFNSDGVDKIYTYEKLANIIEDSLKIWPALYVEAAPYKYSTQDKVFPDRPGVGWMLYLPKRIESSQAPEARMIRHVKDVNGTEGTILVSETDGPFDVGTRAHVKAANDIEIRLADQDLLPRFIDL
jgi:hypothetical protein